LQKPFCHRKKPKSQFASEKSQKSRFASRKSQKANLPVEKAKEAVLQGTRFCLEIKKKLFVPSTMFRQQCSVKTK